MVWLHGGAFNEGMSYGPLDLYNGARLASKGSVCVVGVNYRLGVLGFLVAKGIRGNQGLQDQRAALRFVRDNIDKFGGMPDSVTLWGQSAGAMSVAAHLVMPKSEGLFHRAIMESNVAAFRYQKEEDQMEAFGKSFLKRTPCRGLDDLECLRAQPANETIRWGAEAAGSAAAGVWARILDGGHLLSAFAMEWGPVIDGVELTSEPLMLFSNGNFSKVPVLLGTVQDEGATFIYSGIKSKKSELLWPAAMRAIFGLRDGGKILDFYGNAAKEWHDLRDSLSYVLTDYWFKCSTERIAGSFASRGLSTFLYRYDHVLTFPQIFTEYGLPAICANRTCHASEVPFIFNNFANFTPSPAELIMSDSMISYWTEFAHNSNPNTHPSTETLPHWPHFNSTTRVNLRIGIPIEAESTEKGQSGPGVIPGLRGVCDFFDTEVGYNH